jgi:hypothetical protein
MRVIEGDVVNGSPDSLTVAVRRVERRDGVEEYWKGEHVTIPRGAVVTYSERKLSRSRTALFGAGALAAAFALGQAFGDVTGLFGRSNGGPGSEK